ncbi:MAG: ssDNA-binding protein [Carnobacterium inhibens]|uniref:ssDNA-binding protein n=1 Tax=Carnobacterium sp. TaxID=48221 RepID=UPI0033155CDB
MNAAMFTGKVVSDVKVINTKHGYPFCYIALDVNGKIHNCLIAGQKAFKFVYEVENGTGLTVDCTINERKQLIIQEYKINSQATRYGQLWDYKLNKLPHRKAMN